MSGSSPATSTPPLDLPDDTAVSELPCLAAYQRRDALLALARAIDAWPGAVPTHLYVRIAELAHEYEQLDDPAACPADSSPVPYLVSVLEARASELTGLERQRVLELLEALDAEVRR